MGSWPRAALAESSSVREQLVGSWPRAALSESGSVRERTESRPSRSSGRRRSRRPHRGPRECGCTASQKKPTRVAGPPPLRKGLPCSSSWRFRDPFTRPRTGVVWSLGCGGSAPPEREQKDCLGKVRCHVRCAGPRPRPRRTADIPGSDRLALRRALSPDGHGTSQARHTRAHRPVSREFRSLGSFGSDRWAIRQALSPDGEFRERSTLRSFTQCFPSRGLPGPACVRLASDQRPWHERDLALSPDRVRAALHWMAPGGRS